MKAPLALFCALLALPVNAQSPTQDALTAQRNEIKIAKDEATKRYIQLDTAHKNGINHESSSATRLGCRAAISNFHVLREDSITGEVVEGKLAVVKIVNINTYMDAILFNSATESDVPPVRVAEDVQIGDRLLNFSNLDGRDGFLRPGYFISKVDEKTGMVLLDKPTVQGESGSGLFNLRGELVAIVDGTIPDEKGHNLYGHAVLVKSLLGMLKATYGEDLNYCKQK